MVNIDTDLTYLDIYAKQFANKSKLQNKAISWFAEFWLPCVAIAIWYLIKNWSVRHLVVSVIVVYFAGVLILHFATTYARKLEETSENITGFSLYKWLYECDFVKASYEESLYFRGKRKDETFLLKVEMLMEQFPECNYVVRNAPQTHWCRVGGSLTVQELALAGGLNEKEMELKIHLKESDKIIFEVIKKEKHQPDFEYD